MPKKLLLVLCLAICTSLFSQNRRQPIFGMVSSDSSIIKDVHIFNISSSKGTISNNFGEFQIPVQLNDTLIISDIRFEPQKIIITQVHLKNVQLKIRLESKVNELDEVTLKNHDLSGNLSNDAINVKETNKMNELLLDPNAWKIETSVTDDIDAINKEKAESARRLTDPTEQSNNIISYLMNLGASTVFNQVSKIGQKKRAEKKEQKIYRQQSSEAPDRIRNELGDSFFINTLKIPPQHIKGFINYCASKDIIATYLDGNKIKVIDILLKESKHYLKELKDEE